MKKAFSLLVILFLALSLLSGCGNDVATEKQLLKDLNSSDLAIISAHKVSFSSLEIEKRKTDEEHKTDTVYIWAEGKSNTIRCNVSYILEYELYNDGWVLESIIENNTDQWEIIPSTGVSKQKVEADLKAIRSFDKLELVSSEEDLQNRTCTYTYKLKTEYKYLTETQTVQCSYRLFSYEPDWIGEFYFIGTENDWKLEGDWNICETVHRNGVGSEAICIDAVLSIKDIDSDSITMGFNIETAGSSWEFYMDDEYDDYSFSSFKPITLYKTSHSNITTQDCYVGYIRNHSFSSDDSNVDMLRFQSDTLSSGGTLLCQFVFDRDKGITFEGDWLTGMKLVSLPMLQN